MKILLIEDNTVLVGRIMAHIPEPYVADTAFTGSEAIARIAQVEYRVIVLDLGLPDMPGLDVCRRIRESGNLTPILILTGEDDMTTRLALLDSGADDYMTKPFDARELKARITALGRRQPVAPIEETIVIGDMEIDRRARSVMRAGTPILLRRKEFDILVYLVTNRGKVVTRDMIVGNVWNSNASSWANTVDVHIKNLRDKIDRPFSESLIKTAYGIGYRVEVSDRVTTERSRQ